MNPEQAFQVIDTIITKQHITLSKIIEHTGMDITEILSLAEDFDDTAFYEDFLISLFVRKGVPLDVVSKKDAIQKHRNQVLHYKEIHDIKGPYLLNVHMIHWIYYKCTLYKHKFLSGEVDKRNFQRFHDGIMSAIERIHGFYFPHIQDAEITDEDIASLKQALSMVEELIIIYQDTFFTTRDMVRLNNFISDIRDVHGFVKK